MAKLQINIDDQIKSPTVSNNSVFLNAPSYTFKAADFTKDFNDPEGGAYSFVTLHKVPSITTLLNSGSPVDPGEVIHADNMNNMTITLDDKYAIHNGHLYEFSKSIDAIIVDYEATGYKLIYNNSGLLGFANPTDVADIVVIEGTEITSSQLSFEFSIQATPSDQFSNKATFELVPSENVNLKTNNIFAGLTQVGVDGKSAYEVAIDNGFVGTETEWLATLVGAQGPQGIQGPAGENGTSVTIQGTLAEEADLPVSGNPGDGYLINGYLYVWSGSIWDKVGLIRGPKGDTGAAGTNGTDGTDGRNIEYIWDGTKLGLRYEGQTVYTYSELKGAKGNPGDKGDKGDTGISAYQVWLNLGNSGTQQQFIDSLVGPKGDTGVNGLDGNDGDSAYEVWLALGNVGTTQDFINSLTGPQGERGPRGFTGDQGPAGEDAKFTHNEIQYDWSTGQSQIFTVPLANAITDVYIQGKRAEKANPDDTSDEWRVYSDTQIEILVPLDNGDRITFVESAKFSLTTIAEMLGYTPEDTGNKAIDFITSNHTLFPTVQAVEEYIAAQNYLTSVTKTDVGLGNVDNTSDVDKPVSTAQQTALDAKLDSSTFTGHTHDDRYYTEAETDAAIAGLNSDIAGKIDKQSNITALWRGTQAQYDALTPDPNTIYFIEE